MNRVNHILLMLLAVLALSSCASKRFAKKAYEFENAGLYSDAANYYYLSSVKNPKNVEAKIGLRKNGQIVLDEKLENFLKHYQNGQYQKAVDDYLDAQSYFKKIKNAGTLLNLDESYEEYYNEAKDYYLEDEYGRAIDALNREEFSDAETRFAKILKVQAKYKDAAEKYNIAKFEPVYRLGRSQMNQEQYRTAYYTFSSILNNISEYQQAQTYRDEAFEKASIPVLIAPIVARNRETAVAASQLRQDLQNELQKSKNPFIKVVDISALPKEVLQKDGVHINLAEAQLAGIKAVLSVNLVDIGGTLDSKKKSSQKAYWMEEKKVKDENGEEKKVVEYHKTLYTLYTQTSSAWLKMNYKCIRVEDGNVIGADGIDLSTKDEIAYATYDGNYKLLVPGSWASSRTDSASDKVNTNKSDRNQFLALFKARQKPNSVTTLKNTLLNDAQVQIRQVLDNYKPEK